MRPIIEGMPGDNGGYWPIAGLRLRILAKAGELELRLPDAADLGALAALAEAGVHDPAVQPFGVAWTDVEPAARARSVLQYHWSCLGSWSPANWTLNMVVLRDGAVVGTQGLSAADFNVLREVGTGSWLGRSYQGLGIGSAMRTAALALAFDGLGAEFATSDAFTDNAASLGVSRGLGYRDNGVARQVVRGRPAELQRLRLDRARWEELRTARQSRFGQVSIAGLEPCLVMFGLS